MFANFLVSGYVNSTSERSAASRASQCYGLTGLGFVFSALFCTFTDSQITFS